MHPFTSKSEALFWAKVDKSGGPDACWPWLAYRTNKGYGKFGIVDKSRKGGIRSFQSHRVAWMLTKGDIPVGIKVCHNCDNPPCCNPSHGFLGTDGDNNRDAFLKGRYANRRWPRGEAMWKSKLTASDVIEIRRIWNEGVHSQYIARGFGVTEGHINKICRFALWNHF